MEWTDALVNFTGVFLGGLLAYAVTVAYGHRETQARRSVLFRTLSEQLHKITTEIPPFDATRPLLWSPIRSSAVDEILRGDVLDARKDAKIIKRLIIWQSFEDAYNEEVRVTNQATVTMSIPNQQRPARHQSLSEFQTALTVLRKDVLSVLPPEYQKPTWKQDPAKDKGLLFRFRVEDAPGN